MNERFGLIIFLGDGDALVVELQGLFKIMVLEEGGSLLDFGVEIIHERNMI